MVATGYIGLTELAKFSPKFYVGNVVPFAKKSASPATVQFRFPPRWILRQRNLGARASRGLFFCVGKRAENLTRISYRLCSHQRTQKPIHIDRLGTRRPKATRTKRQPPNSRHQLFGFLTTDANDVVGAIHPKAMPVILTTAGEIETWMTAPTEEALTLQRPLPNGALKIVMTGEKEDG